LFIAAVPFSDADVAKSLLIAISNEIGQIAYLKAKLHQLPRIYFGGFFIRGHPITMHTITYAINYWSKVSSPVLWFMYVQQLTVSVTTMSVLQCSMSMIPCEL